MERLCWVVFSPCPSGTCIFRTKPALAAAWGLFLGSSRLLGFCFRCLRDCQMAEQRSAFQLDPLGGSTGQTSARMSIQDHPQKLQIIWIQFAGRSLDSRVCKWPLEWLISSGPPARQDKGHLETLARSVGHSLKAEK